MNRHFATVLVLLSLTSCGVVGPPVPPENVGVALTVERQKQRDAREAQQREAEPATEEVAPDSAMQGQDVDLPPLRPVGTR